MADNEKTNNIESEDKEGQVTENQGDKNELGVETKTEEQTESERVFTQSQVNGMMTKEKNQGRAAALRDLGIDPKDTKAIEMVKAIIGSQKSNGEEDIATQPNEQSQAIVEAQQRALVAEAKAEAMQQGVQIKFVEDAVTLILARLTDDNDLKTLIGELKIKYPVWFDAFDNSDKGKNVGKKGTGSSINAISDKKAKEDGGLGARLAAQRKTTSSKTKYWGGSK